MLDRVMQHGKVQFFTDLEKAFKVAVLSGIIATTSPAPLAFLYPCDDLVDAKRLKVITEIE